MNHATPREIVYTALKGTIKSGKHLQLPSGHSPDTASLRRLVDELCPFMRVDAWIAVILDIVWVVGSYVLLFAVRFSVGGKWAVAAVAEVVFLFAVIQWLGLRRVVRSGQVA